MSHVHTGKFCGTINPYISLLYKLDSLSINGFELPFWDFHPDLQKCLHPVLDSLKWTTCLIEDIIVFGQIDELEQAAADHKTNLKVLLWWSCKKRSSIRSIAWPNSTNIDHRVEPSPTLEETLDNLMDHVKLFNKDNEFQL